jgi:hypothetical protein
MTMACFLMNDPLPWQECTVPVIRSAPCSTGCSFITLTSSWPTMRVISRRNTVSSGPIIEEVVERYLDCGNPRCEFKDGQQRFPHFFPGHWLGTIGWKAVRVVRSKPFLSSLDVCSGSLVQFLISTSYKSNILLLNVFLGFHRLSSAIASLSWQLKVKQSRKTKGIIASSFFLVSSFLLFFRDIRQIWTVHTCFVFEFLD